MNSYRDLLVELELTRVPSGRPHPDNVSRKPGGIAAHEGDGGGTRRSQFWCALKEHNVEVEFETRSRLGLPRIVDVRRCTAFERPADVTCGRHCLDASFRKQHPFEPPLVMRPGPLGD